MTNGGKQVAAPAVILPSVGAAAGIDLLNKLISKAADLKANPDLHQTDLEAWAMIARDYLVRTFGSESPNVNGVLNATCDTRLLHPGMDDEEERDYWRSGLDHKVKILEICIEQLKTDIELNSPTEENLAAHNRPIVTTLPSKVFVVHGHEHGLKEAVARFLERLDLDPVILHERPNAGRTIIEKFSDYADVQFAVVLLTGDDEARVLGSTGDLAPRARQNVILELGYFLGKLGRARVCALYQSGVEIPSDYHGVLFIPLDSTDRWKFDLVRELRVAGFPIDANRIFSAD